MNTDSVTVLSLQEGLLPQRDRATRCVS